MTALGDKTGIAWSLMGVAGIANLTGRAETAARLLAAAATLRDALGVRLSPFERSIHDRIDAVARTTLGAAMFASAWEAGAVLPLADAVAKAKAIAGGDDHGGTRAAGEVTASSGMHAPSLPAGLTPRQLDDPPSDGGRVVGRRDCLATAHQPPHGFESRRGHLRQTRRP